MRSAVKNSALEFPRIGITVNFAPCLCPERGSAFDLPVAVSILWPTGY
ncbi:MAG: magnesium chelatase domain-containing protein [Christensenellaceae bacterium]